jgi:hypothetical protein
VARLPGGFRSSGRFKQTKQQWWIKDENSRHEDANEHLKKDAKARLKRLRNTHGSGGLVKQVEDLLRQLLPCAIGNTNSRKSRPRPFTKASVKTGAFAVLAFASWGGSSMFVCRITATPAGEIDVEADFGSS